MTVSIPIWLAACLLFMPVLYGLIVLIGSFVLK